MSVKADSSGFDREEFEDSIGQTMKETVTVEYRNVISSAIMNVLVGGILLALGVVIIDDFLAIVPNDAFMSVDEIGGPLTTAFGLAAISLVVPIVGAIVAVLMGSFGGMLGGNGGRGRR